ncbi:hypothetical protein K4L44_03800 [Halosquirtibacter laminarini]|uniref:Uncharacterized protein n=1 Tax=Halosquirtibacter laminarini TaxID=3374600 RepID=A0AC61NH70_9BACT|nr:hypothetical protein K4L44_03800 [Prolixibacteraceae bacterium]
MQIFLFGWNRGVLFAVAIEEEAHGVGVVLGDIFSLYPDLSLVLNNFIVFIPDGVYHALKESRALLIRGLWFGNK